MSTVDGATFIYTYIYKYMYMKVALHIHTFSTVVKLGASVKVGASTVFNSVCDLVFFSGAKLRQGELSRGATFDRVKCCASSLLFFHSG